MNRIHLLNEHLISQIAAGEVVERPASVVKELLENSLDAGAGEVRVELEVGGKRRLMVSDDGSGMGGDDALLAFDRHATSKIASFADLEQVSSLGFRGEALSSIAAVARVDMRTAEQPGDGFLVRIEGGRIKTAEPVAHPRGTRVEVASLFYNVPARRKFLKRPQTEMRRVVEVVQAYALARPEVSFSVFHEGRQVVDALALEKGGEGALRERIGQLFGSALADDLVAIPAPMLPAGEAVRGFVGNRDTRRGRRYFVYVNGRLVRDRQVMSRFYRAVREEWKGDDFPALFLFLELPPELLDVNVHPQKNEVRFRDLRFMERVHGALRATLAMARGEEEAPLREPLSLPSVPAVWQGLGGKQRPDPAAGEPWRALPAASGEGAEAASSEEIREPSPLPYGEPVGQIAQATFAPQKPAAVPLSGRSGRARPFRLLGQYKGTLLLLEGPDGLYLIDQHVAHERLLYERLRRSLDEQAAASQQLLQPLLLELSPAEALRLAELAPALEGYGFEVVEMSGATMALKALPTMLSVTEGEALLQELATSTGEGLAEAEALGQGILDALAASLSCRGAVKMHHPLSVEEMQNLVAELFEAEQPYACPHGRPVVLQMTDAELERRFGRR